MIGNTNEPQDLQAAWEKILTLDTQLTRATEKYAKLFKESQEYRLQMKHQIQILLNMV